MKVKIDDKHDWVFMSQDDGKVYDSKGKEIRWVAIDDAKNPKQFQWKPNGDEPDSDDLVIEKIKRGES